MMQRAAAIDHILRRKIRRTRRGGRSKGRKEKTTLSPEIGGPFASLRGVAD